MRFHANGVYKALSLFAFVALIAVFAMLMGGPVEVVDSDSEVASFDAADLSPVLDPSSPVDISNIGYRTDESVAPVAIDSAQVDISDYGLTADIAARGHPGNTFVALNVDKADDRLAILFISKRQDVKPKPRLTVTNWTTSPDLSARGDGGIL